MASPARTGPIADDQPQQGTEWYRLLSLDVRQLLRTVRSEGWAFFFVCAYLFFEYVRPQSVYPSMDVIPWVPTVLLLCFVSLILESTQKRTSTAAPHALNKLMVVYGCVVLASSALSYYPNISFGKLSDYFNWLIIYFFIVKIVNSRTRFFIFLLAFLVFSFKMSQHGFRSWAMRGFSFADWGVTGAPGWFHNSGEVGIQMALYTPLALMVSLALAPYVNRWVRYILYLMPFTGTATVIASSSRGALIGLAAAGLAGLWRTQYFFRTVFFLLIAGAAVWYTVPDAFMERFETAGDDRTSEHRLERWEDGWAAMKENPVLGVGHAAWPAYYPMHFDPEIEGSLLVHNVFIQCGSELGFTGLAVFVVMILWCFGTNRKIRRQAAAVGDRFYEFTALGMSLALIGLIISASFVTVLYYPYFWIHFAMTASMAVSFRTTYATAASTQTSAGPHGKGQGQPLPGALGNAKGQGTVRP